MSFDTSVLDRLGVAAGLALSIKATLVLVLAHVTVRPVRTLPLASRRVALN